MSELLKRADEGERIERRREEAFRCGCEGEVRGFGGAFRRG
ncbi:MAG: hypothetical protein ACRDSJ_22890 [Rubrobacteraceae bacterium]